MNTTNCLPNVYIIGAQKSGTTTLFDIISQHPQVYANPAEKDFPFFSAKEIYDLGIEELAKFYKCFKKEQILLGAEANALYVEDAPRRLHNIMPNALLILILRDPVKRCISAWRYAVERGLENRSLEQAIQDELNGLKYVNSYERHQKDYLSHGLYGRQIEHLLNFYQRKQIKIIFFEDFVKDPYKIITEIFCFMGIDSDFHPIISKKNETRGKSKFLLLSKFLYKERPVNHVFWSFFRRTFTPELRAIIREWLVEWNRVPASQEPVSCEIKDLLRNYYKSDINKLHQITEHSLDIWHD